MKTIIYIVFIVLLVLFSAFAIWQGFLFVRDIVRKSRSKKNKENKSVTDTDRKE